MAATMMSKAFAGTSLRQAVPTAGKVRQSSPAEVCKCNAACIDCCVQCVWQPPPKLHIHIQCHGAPGYEPGALLTAQLTLASTHASVLAV